MKLIPTLLVLAVVAFSCEPVFAAEELTEVQTVSPLVDKILVWLGAAAVIAGTLASVLPKHLAITQFLARIAVDLRGIRKPDPDKTQKKSDRTWPPPMNSLLVLLALPLGGCAFWSDAVVPTVQECSPEQSYFIEGLGDILEGQNAFAVLDRMKNERGVQFVFCAVHRFLDRVAATPETATQRATARAYLEREQAQ